jgi:LL-diaminopimelate aminotransferase
VPDPAYASYATMAKLIGAQSYAMPLTAENNWLPDLEAIPTAVAEKARILWLNYPNNPTGAVADLAFFEEAVDFCRRYNILLCHDNAYGDVTFDDFEAVSALQVPGAKEVVIELNSLSKTYNMAGWRVGMAVGNAVAVQALGSIKTQIDSGFAEPIQRMAITALTGSQAWIADRNMIYQHRRDKVIAALAEIDIVVPVPKATFYIWFPVPSGYTDLDFQRKLLHEAHLSVAPGAMYGDQGRNWMRVSIGVADDRLDEALDRLKKVRW